jgi:Family of unknown function (DUF6573)
VSDEADIIYTYSREEAFADGILVDVTVQARAAGITFPVALTEAMWKIVSACTAAGQSVEGRLWDTLWMFRLAARRQSGSEVHFSVLYATERGAEEVKLWALCGPGDYGEPVITIMLEGED